MKNFTASSNNNNNNNITSPVPDYQRCPLTNGILRYFGTLIFLVGMISTVLSIAVFARKPLRKCFERQGCTSREDRFFFLLLGRKSCCFYFLILAISDSLHLLMMIIEHFPYSFHVDLLTIHAGVCKLVIFLIYFSNHLSNIVLTLASM